jgi:hypothetical protein
MAVYATGAFKDLSSARGKLGIGGDRDGRWEEGILKRRECIVLFQESIARTTACESYFRQE